MVAPVYRNRGTLAELVERLHTTLDEDGISHQIVLVDDACPEGSGELLDRLAAGDDRLEVIHHPRNLGQHRAVLTGLSAARAEWVVVMDADLQDRPETLPELLQTARGSGEIVFAGRRGRYESWGRLATSFVYRLLLPLVARVPRDAGMFFAAPRGAVAELLAMEVSSPFVVTMLGSTGRRSRSVPVERSRRPNGESAYSGALRLRSALSAFRTAFELRAGGFDRFDAGVALLLLLAALLYLGGAIDRLPYDVGDEGYLGYIAWRVAEGDVLYRDVELWSYFPGYFYLLSWVWQISNDPIVGFRWLWVGLLAFNAAWVYALGALWRARFAGFAAATVSILVPGSWDRAHIATLSLLLLAAALATRSSRRRSALPFPALGALLGGGLWLRADFAFLAAATLVLCLVLDLWKGGLARMMRHAGAAVSGLVVIVVPLVVILARDGIAGEFAAQVLGFLHLAAERSSAWYKLPPPPLSAVAELSRRGAFAFFYYVSWLVPLPLVLMAIAELRRWRFRGAPPTLLVLHGLVLFWLAGNLPQFLLERPGLGHLAQKVFALLVAGMWVLASLRSQKTRRVFAAAASLALAAYAAVYSGFWLNDHPWWVERPAVRHTLANGVSFVAKPPGRARLLDLVLAESPPGAPVASLPFAPGLNVLLRRPMPGPQVYFVPHSLDRAGAEERFIADLERGRVSHLLVFESFAINGRDETLLRNFAPELWGVVEGRYRLVDRRGGLSLYRLGEGFQARAFTHCPGRI